MNNIIFLSMSVGFLLSALISLISLYIYINYKLKFSMNQDLLNLLNELTADINAAKPLLAQAIAAEQAIVAPLQQEIIDLEQLFDTQTAELQAEIDNINNTLQPNIDLTTARLNLKRQELAAASVVLNVFAEVKLDADNEFEMMDEAIVILQDRVTA